jgi:hypothetical protein
MDLRGGRVMIHPSDVAWRGAKYRGTVKLIHVALAEIANKGHDYRLWVGDQYIAEMVGCDRKTVSRAKAQMVKDGFLREAGYDTKTGNKQYLFLMPGDEGYSSVTSISYPAVTDGTSHPLMGHLIPTDGTSHPTAPITNQREPKHPKPLVYTREEEAIWEAYPRTPNRSKALTIRLIRRTVESGTDISILLSATRQFAKEMKDTPPEFIKRAPTFFGPQEIWRDYIPEPEESIDAAIWKQYDEHQMWVDPTGGSHYEPPRCPRPGGEI